VDRMPRYVVLFARMALVRAQSLNVAGLLALVAHALAGGLGRAVAGQVSDFAAVVALLALSAVT